MTHWPSPVAYPGRVPHAYDIVVVNRAGLRRTIAHTSEELLEQGEVIRLDGRFWIVAEVGSGAITQQVEGPDDHHHVAEHAVAKPARYRIRMRHPVGQEEVGVFRRFRTDAPRLGHAFATFEDGSPESWEIVEEHVTAERALRAAGVGLLRPAPPGGEVEIRPLSDYDTALGLTHDEAGGVA